MLRRFKRYITYKFIGYVPGTSKLASMEAKRLSQYIFDNWDETSQITIMNDIKLHLIEMRENQIKNEDIKLLQIQDKLNYLNANIDKLKSK